MSEHCGTTITATLDGVARVALVGSPNAGKTTLFNALTGLRAKTGNYPGVTVARYEGRVETDKGSVVVEDLPGTYSLDPISPDEEIVAQVVENAEDLDGILVVLDSTNLTRGLGLVAQVQQAGKPVAIVLTFVDELLRRGGKLDPAALSRALGLKVLPVIAGEKRGVAALTAIMGDPDSWTAPPVAPPTATDEVVGWAQSVAKAAHYTPPQPDSLTGKLDAVLLHPVWGTLIFFVTMYLFFQTIFVVAAPLQEIFEGAMTSLGDVVRESISNPYLASFVGDAIFGGVGGVVVFLPQIALLFVLISLLEGSGYLARAAYLMDRVMAMAGLEGRAFVALLSSVACAIPGIMATRTLPSAKDRIATMMGAPLMTCSARLPVYILLIGMLVPSDLRWGPFGAQGTIMFGLYLLGAVSAMLAAWFFSRIVGRSRTPMPFYMEMPSYRIPRMRTVLLSVWEACKAFLKKITSIILLTTVVLLVLLNFPLHSDAAMEAAGVNTSDEVAVAAYTIDNSAAAAIGKAVEPVFEPLGFDWRVNIGVLSSLAAREVFVATMGQVASASDPEDPAAALENMTYTSGPNEGTPVFTPPTIAALLVFFVYAMQCMSTLGVMRRETGGWKWPAIAFGYMSVVAWVTAFAAHTVVSLVM